MNLDFHKLKSLIAIFHSGDESSVWKRNLLLLSLSQFIAMVGMNGLVPFLPLFVIELGIKDPTEAKMWSSMMFAGPYFLSIIAVPIWGMLGDKYGQKQMVVRAIFGLGLAVFLMGFSQNVVQLFSLRVFQGAVSGFIASALAFVAKNTPKNRSGYAIGLLQSSSSAGIIVGPFLGGLISDIYGIRSVFFIVAALCVLSGLLIIFFLLESVKGNPENKTSVIDNFLYIVKRPDLRKIVSLIVLTQVAVLLPNPIFPFFVSRLGAPDSMLSTTTGLLIAIVGIFSIIFSPYWGRRNDKEAYGRILAISSAAVALGSLMHLLANHYLWLFPIRGFVGVFFAAIAPTLYAALSYRSPENNKGGLMGIASSANLFGALLSYLLCSVMVTNFDMNSTFLVSSVLMVLVVLAGLFGKNK